MKAHMSHFQRRKLHRRRGRQELWLQRKKREAVSANIMWDHAEDLTKQLCLVVIVQGEERNAVVRPQRMKRKAEPMM